MKTANSVIERKVYTDRYESALFRRVISLNKPNRAHFKHAILLLSGRGELSATANPHDVEGPAILWSSSSGPETFEMGPGSEAIVLGASNGLLLDAVGNGPESVFLRYMLDRNFTMALPENADLRREYMNSFSGVSEELARSRKVSWMLVSAYLRIIVISLWRHTGSEEFAIQNQGETSAILHNFRQLVELHFRDHWTVKAYCNVIGTSHDRLHAICTRELSKTPLQLVHERLAYEAQLLLERSALTVEQISYSLGFRDSSSFSHFFKRRIDLPPSTYRAETIRAQSEAYDFPERGFADWP